jgi:antitoxin HicB
MNDQPNIEQRIEQVMALPYRRELVPNEDGTWFARVVELPGCMSEGDSESAALESLNDAMREWLRVQLEDGDAIPLPSSKQHFSGKFVVRVSETLHREITERAARERVSLNAFVSSVLAQAVAPATAVVDSTGKLTLTPTEYATGLMEVYLPGLGGGFGSSIVPDYSSGLGASFGGFGSDLNLYSWALAARFASDVSSEDSEDSATVSNALATLQKAS